MKDSRTPLARARGFGAAGGAYHHWIAQRLTAVVLIGLLPWCVFSVIPVILRGDAFEGSIWLSQWYNGLLLSLTIVLALWHAKLGLQVIIEDYIHHRIWRPILLLSLICFWLALTALCLYFVITL